MEALGVAGMGEVGPGPAALDYMKTQKQQRRWTLLLYITLASWLTATAPAQPVGGVVRGWGINNNGQTDVPSGLTNVVGLSAGGGFGLALRGDGTVAAWGWSIGGVTNVPSNLSNVVAVAGGMSHALALRADGTVAAWGYNLNGETDVPADLTNAVAISAGAYYSIALRSDGSALVWGDKAAYQGTILREATNLVAIAAGDRHNVALRNDGTVLVWGGGQYPTGYPLDTPPGLSNVVAVAAGMQFSLALKRDGTVAAWGENAYDVTNVPPGLTNVIAIAAKYYNCLALGKDGTLTVWGDNSYGQTNVPPDLANPAAIACGAGFALSLVCTNPPAIIWQPQDRAVATNSFVSLGSAAIGAAPLRYQWQFNGTDIPGATNAILGLPNLRLADEGNYRVVVSNAFGVAISSNAFVNALDLGESLDTTNLGWTTEGDAPWFAQGYHTHNGPAAAESGPIGDRMRSVLRTVVQGPGTLTFWWGCLCEPGIGFVRFSVNGQEQTSITGTTNWEARTVLLGKGDQILRWTVTATNASPNGFNGGWLDQVGFVAGGVPPAITLNPTNQVVLAGSGTTLAGAALGTPPLGYQWLLDSVPVPGATNAMLTITNAGPADQGTYTLVVTNDFGATNTAGAFINVADLTKAINATNLAWSTAGDRPWFPETSVTHDGIAALRSGLIAGSQRSTLQTTVQGPGTLTFWWKVSSETNNDVVNFAVDGLEQTRISGTVDWRRVTQYLATGPHSLAWTYSKNATTTGGSDTAWLDEVTYTEGGVPPFALSGPSDQVVALGSNATLNVVAGGTPPVQYQWFFRNAPIPGATTATLSVTNVQLTEVGNYAVALTNDYGGAVSPDANLRLLNVYAWGAGRSTAGTPNLGQSLVPTNLATATAVAAGGYHSLALRADGRVVAWGSNSASQTNVPAALTNARGISAGFYHSLALRSNGVPIAWGSPSYSLGVVPSTATGIVSIASGWYHNLALRTNGTVVAWGAGTTGGAWPYFGQSAPPTNLAGVKAIAAGGYHSLALRSNGTVVAWGWNAAGQTNVPSDLSNVVAIAAGGSNSLALKADGTLVAWGDNTYGQRTVPPGLSNVVAIAAGAGHSLALRNDGTLVAWGLNVNGQTNVPANLTNVAAISAGAFHNLAVVNGGPITILAQPLAQSVYQDNPVTLSAACLGAAPLAYQWLRDGTNVAGANGPFLSFPAAQPADSGVYLLVISNFFGQVTSAPARLDVYGAGPFIVQQPTNQTVLQGSSFTLAASVRGVLPLAYQWYKDGAALSGKTTATLAVTNAQPGSAGVYVLAVTNSFGAALSSNAVVTVIDLALALNATNLVWTTSGNPPWLPVTNVTHDGVAAASSGAISATNSSSLETIVTGPGTLSFWWRSSGSFGGTYFNFYVDDTYQGVLFSSTWQSKTVYLAAGQHRLRWSPAVTPGAPYTLTGWVDEVTLVPGVTPPLILSPLSDRTVPAGTNVVFSVGLGGTPPLSGQWFFNGTPIAGATGSSLSVSNVQARDEGLYSFTLTNAYGATNTTAALTVTPSAPWIALHPVDQRAVPGGACVFTAAGQGSEPLYCQWRFNGNALSGATQWSLALSGVSYGNVGNYELVVSNAQGVAVSSNATLSLAPSMLIAWGDNFFGQANVPALSSQVTAFAGGWDFSVAATADGGITNWGFTEAPFSRPVWDVTALAAGGNHMLALGADGTVTAAGQTVPLGLGNTIAIGAGYGFSLALQSDGTVAAWASSSSSVTNLPPGLTNVVGIAAGWNHALALKANGGVVVAWGNNFRGSTVVPPGLRDVAAVAAGWYHSLVLKHDGTVVAWGDNTSGQCNVPAGLRDVVAITGGESHSLALKSDGTVVAWGTSQAGQTSVPATATNVAAIASGSDHSLALLKPPGLAILRQPQSVSLFDQQPVAFSVGAVGAPPLACQWRFNGQDIPGASRALLAFNAAPENAGTYDVVVTNAFGAQTSSVAVLTVRERPAIRQPVGGFLSATGAFAFDLTGPDGLVLTVEGSTNLVDWVVVQSNVLTNGQARFSDPQPGMNRRFFRLRFD